MKKIKIILADLAYISAREYVHPLPLNVGYIGAYLKRELNSIQVELIKDPNELYGKLKEIRDHSIIALTNYDWNMRLNLNFLKLVKEKNPGIVTVMGGPNIDADPEKSLKEFFLSVPDLDFYILGEGERKFCALIRSLIEGRMAPDWNKLPDSVLGFDRKRKILLRGRGPNIGPCDLNEVSSPYLNGMLDKFLDDPRLAPIIETSRGCPFHCAYCYWGSSVNSRIRQFPLEIVLEEIEYISKRTKNPMKLLYVADGNFGIFKRDESIAKALKGANLKTGFPGSIYIYFAKNTNQTIFKIGRHLSGLTSISMSKQSLNKEVLKIIGRANIPDNKYKLLHNKIIELGMAPYCELIYGLPGETLDSFLDGLEVTAGAGIKPVLYPLLLIKGTKINSEEYRKKYRIGSAFRIIPRYTGTYGAVNSVEYEEVAISNSRFSRDDFFKVRLVHFLYFIFSEKIFEELVKYLFEKKLNVISFIRFIVSGRGDWPEFLVSLIGRFEEDTRNEMIEKKDLKFEFSKKEITDIRSHPLALNIYHFCRLVADKKSVSAFEQYLSLVLKKYFNVNKAQYSTNEISVIMDACFDKVPDFPEIEPVRMKKYHYDLDSWLNSRGKKLCDYRIKGIVKYKFHFDKKWISLFNEQYSKYSNPELGLYWFRMNFIGNPHLAYTYERSIIEKSSLTL